MIRQPKRYSWSTILYLLMILFTVFMVVLGLGISPSDLYILNRREHDRLCEVHYAVEGRSLTQYSRC